MRTAVSIVKNLKAMSFSMNVARESRALFVAQAVAFQVTLDPSQSVDQNVGANEKTLNDVINGVNEYLPLDVKLTKAAFAHMVKARLALITGVCDTALLKCALASAAMRDEFGQEKMQLIESMITHPEFGQAQEQVRAESTQGTDEAAA